MRFRLARSWKVALLPATLLLCVMPPFAQAQRERERGNKPAARALFEKALQIDPQRWQPHAYLAEMLLSSEDWPQPYEHLARMDEIDPDSIVGNYLLAK